MGALLRVVPSVQRQPISLLGKDGEKWGTPDRLFSLSIVSTKNRVGWPSRATLPPAWAIVFIALRSQYVGERFLKRQSVSRSPEMLELKQRPILQAAPEADFESKQPRRLLLALGILLIALVAI